MSAINNLKGHIVKDSKVLHYERLENNLYFAVVLMYEPIYDGGGFKNSSNLSCLAIMTTGNKTNYGNGVVALDDAVYIENEINGCFSDLRQTTTKDGYVVSQKAYNYTEINIDDKKIRRRMVKWVVEVPKNDLIKYCL